MGIDKRELDVVCVCVCVDSSFAYIQYYTILSVSCHFLAKNRQHTLRNLVYLKFTARAHVTGMLLKGRIPDIDT